MGLAKGFTNNKNGRPKGKPNKVTTSTREFIAKFVKRNSRRLQKDFDNLDSFQRVTVMERLFAYTAPKQSSIDQTMQIGSLTDEQLNELFNKLIQNAKR